MSVKHTEYFDTDGKRWVSIKVMSEMSGVCPSSIRGYERLGLFNLYGIKVLRESGGRRYYDPKQSYRLAQVKAERISSRNAILSSFAKD